MGAGTILRGLDLFDRVVLVLPAALDQPRTQAAAFLTLARAIETADEARIADALRQSQPEAVRDRSDVLDWSRARAHELAGSDLAAMVRALATQQPIDDRADLAGYAGEVLVLAQEGDALHPVEVAVELAETFPKARLEVLPPGGLMWAHRAKVREVVSGFLNED
ncbi:alpha/beta fold hydrolase [Tenggerimyces flavus]|uniref:Alpha/beta fold hydrolase n=1 Tax=Tenggerimyces flavus TaxID=1708749 RepID=A0ABV7Y906_9ACTN|nr:hypothetical protein [Tenggerimyces flavus]MBM7783796.1 pimeloyl-ACP methyl ester carboxylesterase [Tenggerimyces flavus]